MLSGHSESSYNIYGGQQLMAIRSLDFEEYYEDAKKNEYGDQAKQTIYDIGCALVDMKVVKYNGNKYILNKWFGDYDSWKYAKDTIEKNCKYLVKMGHPKFSR